MFWWGFTWRVGAQDATPTDVVPTVSSPTGGATVEETVRATNLRIQQAMYEKQLADARAVLRQHNKDHHGH